MLFSSSSPLGVTKLTVLTSSVASMNENLNLDLSLLSFETWFSDVMLFLEKGQES